MNALQGSLSLYSLESNLEKLGSDINQVYDACLDRISTQPGGLGPLGVKSILWVVHAKRLLRVNELLQAYVASLSSDDFNDQAFEPLTQSSDSLDRGPSSSSPGNMRGFYSQKLTRLL